MGDKKYKSKRKQNAAAAAAATSVEGAEATVGKQQQRTLSRMNPNQKEAIIAFMEGHAEILSAAVSRLHPRELVEALWSQLTTQLNELGHVPKTTNTWKKTWFDLRREVKAKLGVPPYGSHLMALPGDMSASGQRGRIAALMTRAVRICQQHAANSLRGALQQGERGDNVTADSNEDEDRQKHQEHHHHQAEEPLSPPVVEMSVKCEPPDFAGFDLEELTAIQQHQQQNHHLPTSNGSHIMIGEDSPDTSPPPPKRARGNAREEPRVSDAIQILAASQDRMAMAMDNFASIARGIGEIFRHRNSIEAEKAEALRQIAHALRSKSNTF